MGLAFVLLSHAHSAQAAVPLISTIPDQSTTKGADYSYTPALSNTSAAGSVNWSKAYGPDDAVVNPANGSVRWSIPSSLPSESFHIGLKASNADGHTIESWIVHVSVPKVVYVGPNETDKTISAAFSKHTQAGTTFIVRNGTYSGEANGIMRTKMGAHQYPPQGTASTYSTVMAEDPGAVTLTGGAVIDINGIGGAYSYAAIKGFFVKGGYVATTGYDQSMCSFSSCRPHHIKFIQNGAESAGDIPMIAFRSDDILFENNYAFGGGRYKFASYQASRVVFRRNVARYDRSNNEMAEPKGTYSIYTTMNATVSNNLAVDGDKSQFVTLGQLAGEFTCPTTSGATRVTFDRNMQLNSEMLFGNIDHQAAPCDAEIKDVVSWDVRPADVYVMTRAGSWFDHVTMGKIRPRSGYASQLFNGWPSDLARGMTNSVLHDITNGDLFYGFTKQTGVNLIDRRVDRYGVDAVNITGVAGKLNVNGTTMGTTTSFSPLYSSGNSSGGLRYLTRIEPGSNLSGKAKDGGDLGATVMTFKGKSGTFWGETGYNAETDVPMWPFPFEDVIRAKMAAYQYTGTTYSGNEYSRVSAGTGTISGARGFATSDQTLTHYVWNYLGNTVPPFNVNAIPGAAQVKLRWDPPAPKARATQAGFRVYDYNPTTRAMSNPRAVAKGVYEYTVTGLTNSSNTTFVVTAIDSATGESSFSYPAGATPSEKSPPMPPTVTGSQVVN